MTKMTAAIVEDMPNARQMLENDLKELFPEIEIIGSAESVISAAKMLKKQQPDILFLDIMLGDGTGFDLLEIIPNLSSKIIFVTATDEHALKAFRFSAIDYLLKPIDREKLKQAIERAKQFITHTQDSLDVLTNVIRNPKSLPKKISLPDNEKIVVVEIKDILRCEADGNGTWFYLANKERYFVTKTLKHYENTLVDHSFFRVHQSHLVNTHFIKEFLRKDGGYLKMTNGDLVTVSVRKKAAVLELLEAL